MKIVDRRVEMLREEVDKFKILLDEPEPGLFTWCGFVVDRVRAINEIMEGKRD